MNIHKIYTDDGRPMTGVVHAQFITSGQTLCATPVHNPSNWAATNARITCKRCLALIDKGAAIYPANREEADFTTQLRSAQRDAHQIIQEKCPPEFKHLNICLSMSSLSQQEIEDWYKLMEASDSTPLLVQALRSLLDIIWHDYLVSRKLKTEVETDISLDGLDMIVSD